jgi:RNA polymerase sigma factor (sigma-70 family)
MALGSLIRPHSRRTSTSVPAGSGSDEELLRRFTRTGDEVAFAALVRRHGPAVYGVCRRVLRDDHLAEDAFQNTFLVLARKARAIDRPAALAGWLYGVALRVALKARPPASPAPLAEPATDPSDPTGRLVADELRLALDEEVARLPDADRDLLVLVYLEGKTHDEAARALGCPLGSVAWRLGKARDNLRRRLLRRGIELSVGALLLLAFTGRAQAVSEGMIRRATTTAAVRPAPESADPPARRIPIGLLLPLALGLVATAILGWQAFGGSAAAPACHPAPVESAVQRTEPGAAAVAFNSTCSTPP